MSRLLPAMVALMMLAGCVQQMTEQPKYTALEGSRFYSDGRSARHVVPGTVARGHLRNDVFLYQGKTRPTPPDAYMAAMTDGDKSPVRPTLEQIRRIAYVEQFPFPITKTMLRRGQDRYRVYCSVCHGPLGYGNGIVVERGYTQPPSYHVDRLREAPVGYFYDVISHGLGSMPDYSFQIDPRDRWAIIAYLRALQLSQHAELGSMPQETRKMVLEHLEDRR